MLKAVIIDDEARARRILESCLVDYCKQVNIVGFAEDVVEGVKLIQKTKPDIVFLDIEMPGYNGFQLLEFFDEINFEIIFVTAYTEFALKAFQVSAIDYLLKPLQIEQLVKAVEKVEKLKNISDVVKRFEVLKENIATNAIKKIVVQQTVGNLYIDVAEITHLKNEGSYVNIYLTNGKKILASKNIKDFENQLTATEGFFRTHRSYLVNKQHIVNTLKGDTEAIMSNKETIHISREKKVDFLEFITQ
jgi:two-component system, LytTR family, response regulator